MKDAAEGMISGSMILGDLKIALNEYNKFILAKANVDENRGIAQRYRVTSIPSIKMFKNGEIVAEFIGAIPEEQVREWLDKNLKDG